MPDTCGNLDIQEKQFKSMNVKFCSAWTRFSEPDSCYFIFYNDLLAIRVQNWGKYLISCLLINENN